MQSRVVVPAHIVSLHIVPSCSLHPQNKQNKPMVAPPTTPPTEPEPEPKEELPPAPLVVTPASPTSKKLPSSDSGEDSSKENKENGNMDKAQLRAAARRKGQLGLFFTSVFFVGSSPSKHARSFASSPVNSSPVKSSFMLSIHLRFGLPILLPRHMHYDQTFA